MRLAVAWGRLLDQLAQPPKRARCQVPGFAQSLQALFLFGMEVRQSDEICQQLGQGMFEIGKVVHCLARFATTVA